jgi:hypothetical protein
MSANRPEGEPGKKDESKGKNKEKIGGEVI